MSETALPIVIKAVHHCLSILLIEAFVLELRGHGGLRTANNSVRTYLLDYNLHNVLQHGMGIPSVGILLHEVIKLMYHAKVRDPVFFRIGTCGGIGYEGGSVVISEEAVDGALKNCLELVSTW